MIYSHGEAIVYNGRLVTVEGVTHHSFGTRVSFRDGRAVFSSDLLGHTGWRRGGPGKFD